MKSKLIIILFLLLAGCLPKDSVQLRDVSNFSLAMGTGGQAISGDAVFFNPNSSRMKLRQVKIDVYLDGEKSAFVDQDSKVVAKPKSEFTIPVVLQLKEGLRIQDLLLAAIKGKKYQVRYVGHLKVNVNGFPVRIPIDHEEELKLSF
jgi:LEA14-like dessication related protein